MTKYCALIGPKLYGGKDDLPGVGFFGGTVILQNYINKTDFTLVTPHENAYKKT